MIKMSENEDDLYPYIDHGIMSTNGQLTINKQTRKQLDIEQGDMVYFRILKVEDDMGLPKWIDEKEKERMMKVYREEVDVEDEFDGDRPEEEGE